MTTAQARKKITSAGYRIIATTTFAEGVSYDALWGTGRTGKLIRGPVLPEPHKAMEGLAKLCRVL